MSRSRALSLSLVALAAAALALTGCSSDDGGSGKGSGGTGGGKGSAELTYQGGDGGKLSIDSVGCATLDGKLTAITAPADADSENPAKPSFTAAVSGEKAMVTLTTKDGTTYLHAAAPGVTGRESGDTWVVTVAGLKLEPTDPSGESITVDGTITCGSVVGI
ncbi:hypothetical protein [Streptomyces sp. NBC_00525]|uniref:hypothetical protein n=1 Tax=Streptomyces sp. NBC_00525 TaxID=2903660 RepID=UPI002E7FBA41|nr:hypothetical protein [Streptomyces sp. NBC_00525]WUC93710.1 hypothetical protein OG710_08880 [Streptomyces sp. NBC_00525]